MKLKHTKVATLAATLITFGSLVGGANAAITASFTGSVNPISSPDFQTNLSPLPEASSVSSPQIIDGFVFTQVNGDINNIYTNHDPGGQTGGRSWYPDGGDFGYTEISHTNGNKSSEFAAFVGSGFSGAPMFLAYEVVNNGGVIASGVLSGHTRSYSWFSISGDSGEQFDTIRFRDSYTSVMTVTDGTNNALSIDQVSISIVPEPSSTALLGLGGIALMLRRRR